MDELAFERDMAEYRACERCRIAGDVLRNADRRVREAERDVQDAEQRVAALQSERVQAQNQLLQWQNRQAGLQQQKDNMDREWLPQSTSCQGTFQQYESGKAKHVVSCAPT